MEFARLFTIRWVVVGRTTGVETRLDHHDVRALLGFFGEQLRDQGAPFDAVQLFAQGLGTLLHDVLPQLDQILALERGLQGCEQIE